MVSDAAAAPFEISAYLEDRRTRIDQALDSTLPPSKKAPCRLHEAMRYSVFAGGKRLRPILALATAEALQSDQPAVWDLAVALELVHTYSLIHDDLPAMDDDDFRRGRPACHRKFGEGIAILAGNALLTLALERLTEPVSSLDPTLQLRVQGRLLRAIGSSDGMIAGQAVDLLSQGQDLEETELERMHHAKTGALIAACVGCAGRLCGAGPEQVAALDGFGREIGLAFQIVDDILDVEGSSDELGKTAGKDALRRKATYPAVHGLAESRSRVGSLIEAAVSRLDPLGRPAEPLAEIARFVSVRRV